MLSRLSLLLCWLFALLSQAQQPTAFPVYVWQQWSDSTDAQSLLRDFTTWKQHGVTGVCYNAGFDLERIRTAAVTARRLGLEFHAWIPTLTQSGRDSTWYTVNRLGESAYDKPVYVDYYTTLDPHNSEVVSWLCEKFERVSEIPEVDYIQLDYIRYADVILARGLWEKYGLVMHNEYSRADYCYCDSCVSDFLRQSGIDIRRVPDPSKIKAWAQFRCDNVTRCVNRICAVVHAKGKKVSADVFPGPASHAEWMVRQQWQNWDVDAFFPMNYNDFYLQPPSWIEQVTAEAVNAVSHRQVPVYSGLFICRDWRNKAQLVDPEHSGLVPNEIPEALRGSLRAGAKGVALFMPQHMTEEHWQAFNKTMKELINPNNPSLSPTHPAPLP